MSSPGTGARQWAVSGFHVTSFFTLQRLLLFENFMIEVLCPYSSFVRTLPAELLFTPSFFLRPLVWEKNIHA